MKQKWHNQYYILNYMINSEFFKVILALSAIFIIYGCTLSSGIEHVLEASILIYQFPHFIIFFYTLIFLLIYHIVTTFNSQFSFYIIRLKTKENYLKELLKTTLLITTLYLVVVIGLLFLLLCFLKLGNLGITEYMHYSVSNLVFYIFYSIRFIIFSLLISFLAILLLLNFKSKISFVGGAFFLSGFELTSVSSKIRNFPSFNLFSYYGNMIYSSFLTEVCFSLLMIFILEVICYLGYYGTLKNKSWVIS